jgi:glycosyltransferase involved in cell wall biosynthesis
MKRISIILPATDETYSLTKTVEQCCSLLLERYALQFLVVTSPVLTTPECRAAIASLPRDLQGAEILTFDQEKKGMGGALQDAFSYVVGDYVVLMASDLETDPVVLPSLLSKLEEGFDIAATTRWRGGARFKGYNPIKLVLNYGFQLIFRALYFTSLSDLTYAYRAYKSEVLKNINWEEFGFPFLFETIVKPLRLGYKVTEVEAPWRARSEGVSHATWKQVFAYTKLGLRVRFLPKDKIRYTVSHE